MSKKRFEYQTAEVYTVDVERGKLSEVISSRSEAGWELKFLQDSVVGSAHVLVLVFERPV